MVLPCSGFNIVQEFLTLHVHLLRELGANLCPLPLCFTCEMSRTSTLQQQKIDVACKSASMILVDDAPDLVDLSRPISEVLDDDFP